MKYSAVLLALFATVALAMPTGGDDPKDPKDPKPTDDCDCDDNGGGDNGGGDNGGGDNGGGDNGGGSYGPCSGLYDSALCCATDVLGVANLDCGSPPSVPTSPDDFSAVCAAIGQRARCCVLPVLNQAVLCQTPLGVDD